MSTLKVNNLEDLGADAVVTNGVIASSALPAGSILQVVSTTKTDVFVSTSTSWTDVTGYSATITPSSTSSKILVMMSYFWSPGGTDRLYTARVLRDGALVFGGDASTGRAQGIDAVWNESSIYQQTQTGERSQVTFLDTPATTSAITYKMQVLGDARGSVQVKFNSSNADGTSPFEGYIRTASSFTLMEVAG